MPRKVITDWDEYLEHRQEVRFNWWKRYFRREIASARDKEFARRYQIDWFNKYIDEHWSNGRTRSVSHINNSHNSIEQAEYFFYANLCANFSEVCRLTSQAPVSVFLQKNFPDLIQQYKNRLLNITSGNEVDKVDTKLSNSNYDFQKDIVDWLASLSARDRIVSGLIIESIYLEPSSSETSINDENNLEPLNQSVEGLSRKKSELPMFPTGATVFSRWYEFGMAIHKYDRGTRSMTHNEIINAVATDKNFSAKNVKRGYEMVKYINKHCPPEIQDNQPKIHTWLKSLTTN